MSRVTVLNKQPRMYDRLRAWRKGEPLLDGAPMWAVPGEWGSIKWTDGERTIWPDVLDEWEPESPRARGW